MTFSAVPTAFRVRTSGGEWWAPCAWDALGISASETQALFTELGLTDPFWRLAAPASTPES